MQVERSDHVLVAGRRSSCRVVAGRSSRRSRTRGRRSSSHPSANVVREVERGDGDAESWACSDGGRQSCLDWPGVDDPCSHDNRYGYLDVLTQATDTAPDRANRQPQVGVDTRYGEPAISMLRLEWGRCVFCAPVLRPQRLGCVLARVNAHCGRNRAAAVSRCGCDGRVSPNRTRQDPLNSRVPRDSHNTMCRS